MMTTSWIARRVSASHALRLFALCCTLSASACASKPPAPEGDARIAGAITGLTVASEHGHALAWSTPPAMEIVIAPDDLACSPKGGGDRVVLDVAQQATGTFTVVVGHPYVSLLGPGQARAAVCPAGDAAQQPPCHELVRGGTITITRLDAAAGGMVEGTFHIELADGTLDGTFSAARCT